VETRHGFASGNFFFCSQWLPPLSNKIWHCEVLEDLLASSEKFRFAKAWGWKSMLTWADVLILIELLGLLSGRQLGWWI
jgi:hypothetical protein